MMQGTWPVWVALVALCITHVGMFALGVLGALFVRWISFRPFAQKQAPMNEQKIAAMADRIARQQVNAERYAYFERNQQVSRPEVQIEESFVPSKKP